MPDIVDKRGLCPGFFDCAYNALFFAVEYNIREPRREYFINPFCDLFGFDIIRDLFVLFRRIENQR